MGCKECDKDLAQTDGKRKKEFCNSTCRSNFWQKNRKKKKEIIIKDLNEQTGLKKLMPPKTTNVVVNTKPDISEMEALFQKIKSENK